jgi:hypothetical protein
VKRELDPLGIGVSPVTDAQQEVRIRLGKDGVGDVTGREPARAIAGKIELGNG